MNNKTTIAFVILTWNSQAYIADCLDSIIRCDGVEPFILVVDNGSEDSTPRILHRYEDENPFVKVFYKNENLGTTVSRNLALNQLTGKQDYICILDSDTVVNEEALLGLSGFLSENPKVGIVGPSMHNSAGQVQMSGRNFPSIATKLLKIMPIHFLQEKGTLLETPTASIKGGFQDVQYLLSACWLMTWETFCNIGLLDEQIFYAPEDVDYCARAHLAGYRVVCLHSVSIVHEYQRISKKKLFSKTNFEHVRGLIYYFNKYRGIQTTSETSD